MTMQNQSQLAPLAPVAEAAARLLPGIISTLEEHSGDKLADAVATAATRLHGIALFLRQGSSGYGKVLRDAGGEIRRAQERARAGIPETGFASFEERAAALRESDARVANDIGRQSARTFSLERAAQAQRLADGVVSAFKSARAIIDAEFATQVGPLSLNMPGGGMLSADELAQVNATRDELRHMKPTMLRKLYDGYAAGGADDARATVFVIAVGPLLEDIARSPLQQLADRWGMRLSSNERDGGDVGAQKRAALQLRDLITAEREAAIPEASKVAKVIFEHRLLPAFSKLLGYNEAWLSRAEVDARKSNDYRSALDVHGAWFERALPTSIR